jgi:WD40 repeat protein
MTMHDQRFDRVLPDLFVELASAKTPDYLEAAIDRASSRPQRPSWTFPGRWLPVQFTTHAVQSARMPWRQLGVLALIALLLAIAAVAYVGTHRPPSPAPFFGRAGNGQIALEHNGDIVTVDRATGTTTQITTGPEFDSAPTFSRDGTRIAFERRLAGAVRRSIMVANADGSGLVRATPEALSGLGWWTLSPDGKDLLVTVNNQGVSTLQVLAVDGSRAATAIHVPLPATPDRLEWVTYRPNHDREILVAGQPEGSETRGLYVADAATGALLRTIVEPAPDFDIANPQWSSTGDAVGYHRFALEGTDAGVRYHVVSADGTDDRLIDSTPGITSDSALSEWSNDGTRLIVVRSPTSTDPSERMQIVSERGDSAPVEIDCGPDACPGSWIWSPDDSTLLGATTVGYVLADPATGQVTKLDWKAVGTPTWQRIGR